MINTAGGNSKWELLSITVDSGAAESVIPENRCTQYPTRDTERSLSGMQYQGADGSKIPNMGEKAVSGVTQDGVHTRMNFQVCPVTKALGSVSKMTKQGHRVVFDSEEYGEGSYIENKMTGSRKYLREHNGIYILDVWVKPYQSQGFPRQDI